MNIMGRTDVTGMTWWRATAHRRARGSPWGLPALRCWVSVSDLRRPKACTKTSMLGKQAWALKCTLPKSPSEDTSLGQVCLQSKGGLSHAQGNRTEGPSYQNGFIQRGVTELWCLHDWQGISTDEDDHSPQTSPALIYACQNKTWCQDWEAITQDSHECRKV